MKRVLRIVGDLGVESTADLTTELAARFVTQRSEVVCPNTVRGELSYLRAACNYAFEEGYLERVPRFKRVRPRKSPPKSTVVHSIGDIGRVLDRLQSRAPDWIEHRLYALTALAAHTGARRDEMLWSQCWDFNLTTGLRLVQERRRLKTEASAAPVPLCPELREVLAGWLARVDSVWMFPGVKGRGCWHGGVCGARPTDRLKQAGEAVGVEGLTFASLRHTFSTWARREWNLSDIQLADVLRHTTPETAARHYVHPGKLSALVASVDRVSYRRAS
jgi:integrase